MSNPLLNNVNEPIEDLEHLKFKETFEGRAVKVTVVENLGSILNGVKFDYIGVTYPSATVENYTYRLGGSGGTIEAVLVVTYTTSSKDFLASVFRSV